MRLNLGGHWLAFLWALIPGQGAQLTEAVKKARSAKASFFELIYHALNGMGPEETAKALKDGGMDKAVMCIFYPDGADGAEPPMGDPLSKNDVLFEKAVVTFREVINFIVALRTFGISIDHIVGPSCWVLGKKYDDAPTKDELSRRIVRFYKALEDDLKNAKIHVSIELLRAEEDKVFETVEFAISVINVLNSYLGKMFGFHFDTFHIDARGYDQVVCIKALGKLITHLHVNGTGRRPAGGDGDKIDWPNVTKALSSAGIDRLGATNEPFCALVRQNNPTLGTGLPDPVEEPGGILQTRKTLEKYDVKIS